MDCDHIGRTYENQKEERNGITMYLYVCHDCQTGFYSAYPPRMEDSWDYREDYGLYDDLNDWGF